MHASPDPQGTIGALKFTQIDKQGFEDRAYRLHYNESQSRADAFANAGAAVGLAAAALLLPRGSPPLSYGLAAAGGSAVGTALGVAAHVASRPPEHRTPNKALHELVRSD
ncbi:hypothetical protein GPECTOR_1431g631 [Gonium pectorale]|uniref:Glycine zipper domain-containing protein n=1 Tax=Gonium pectorale TaxID=33097 RepID=A0A150FTF3_GONPE|nr:hypothetical protein GPECTOR_1431g631 [Gonium pectorale]|eukprot:KXZ40901.1 hypothetical protein GPECTOR_1431g631 [Gonium pectorale]